jgi:prepilin-type processing-associated H-X9-DG protein
MTNSRIGFRHPGTKGMNTAANAAFADGHAETLDGYSFPCSYAKSTSYASNAGTTTLALQEQQNLTGASVYADPNGALAIFLGNNPGAN